MPRALADLGMFVCRTCLVSLRAGISRPAARPPWTAATATTALRSVATQSNGRTRRRAGPGRTAGARQTAAHDEAPGVTFRMFDQEDDGSLRLVDSHGLDQEVEAQLAELEGKLRDTAQLVRRLEKSGPAKKRAERLRKKYGAVRDSGEDEADPLETWGGEKVSKEEDAAIAEAVRIEVLHLSNTSRLRVGQLNKGLKPAAKRLRRGAVAIDDKLITDLWSRYGAARTALSEAWSNVPAAAWKSLWGVLTWRPQGGTRNRRRMVHVYYLVKDMQAAGVALTDEQQLLGMEAMFVEGWPALALDNWRRSAHTLGTRPATAAAYWALGVRMCARHGDLERAARAAEQLFDRALGGTATTPRVLFPLIRAAAAQDDVAQATAAYRRLQALLGPDMAMADYDEVVAAFLAANQTEQAFAVFVDMMFAGAVDVRRQQRLPSSVANHFFFGKWLKRLLGAGDRAGALRVLLFMQAHGVMPAAVQVNGLLGAWLRTGLAADQTRADELAWHMIAARRLFVQLRARRTVVELQATARPGVTTTTPTPTTGTTSGPTSHTQEPSPTDLYLVPRASLETFALLADNYKDRGQVARLEALWVAFQECQMAAPADAASAYMMNQLLDAYLHDGRPSEARDMYDRMRAAAITPNGHTFAVLFRALALQADLAACRALFAEMVRVADADPAISPLVRRATAPQIAGLGRFVLHALRRAGDYVGLVVAVRALRPLLGGRFAVSDRLAVELVAEAPVTEPGYTDGPRAEGAAALRRRILRASELVDALLRERAAWRRQQQEDEHGSRGSAAAGDHEGDTATPAPTADDLADDLAAVVAYYYRRKCKVDDEAFTALHAEAAREMGLAKQ